MVLMDVVARLARAFGGVETARASATNAFVVFEDAAAAAAALAAGRIKLEGTSEGGGGGAGKVVRLERLATDLADARRVGGFGEYEYDAARTVFVGGVPFDATEAELVACFAPHETEAEAAVAVEGEGAAVEAEVEDLAVEAVRVVRDRLTGEGKGVAFVLFRSEAGRNNALKRSKRWKLREGKAKRTLRVSAPRDWDAPGAPGARRAEDREHERGGGRAEGGGGGNRPNRHTTFDDGNEGGDSGEPDAQKRPAVAARKGKGGEGRHKRRERDEHGGEGGADGGEGSVKKKKKKKMRWRDMDEDTRKKKEAEAAERKRRFEAGIPHGGE
eukprot:PRCOL_00000761-RA